MSETSKDRIDLPDIGSVWKYKGDTIQVFATPNDGCNEVLARVLYKDSPATVQFYQREGFYADCLFVALPPTPPKPRSLTREEEIQAQAERMFWEAAACAFVASVPCAKAAGEAPAVADWLTEQWRMRFCPEASRMYEIPK